MVKSIECDLTNYSNTILMKIFNVGRGTIYKWKKERKIPFKEDYVQVAINLLSGRIVQVDISKEEL